MEVKSCLKRGVTWEVNTIEDILKLQSLTVEDVQNDELLQKVVDYYNTYYTTVDIAGVLDTTHEKQYVVLRVSDGKCTKYLYINELDSIKDSDKNELINTLKNENRQLKEEVQRLLEEREKLLTEIRSLITKLMILEETQKQKKKSEVSYNV